MNKVTDDRRCVPSAIGNIVAFEGCYYLRYSGGWVCLNEPTISFDVGADFSKAELLPAGTKVTITIGNWK